MEEIKKDSCSTEQKKCCKKGIIIIVICSLACFFLGYYFGNKSNSNINRVVGSGINRPFVPRTPRIPNRIPNIQKPNIPNIKQPNIPNIQPPKVNLPQSAQKKEEQISQVNPNNTKK